MWERILDARFVTACMSERMPPGGHFGLKCVFLDSEKVVKLEIIPRGYLR
jgi:hypothetical protein